MKGKCDQTTASFIENDTKEFRLLVYFCPFSLSYFIIIQINAQIRKSETDVLIHGFSNKSSISFDKIQDLTVKICIVCFALDGNGRPHTI